MRLFLPLSRKSLLLIGFIAVLVFLYQITRHPRVTKTMQPVAYYNNYDEPVCLPDKLLETHPPTERAKAAMVILVKNSEQEAIAKTLVNLEDKFNKHFHYPYVFLNNEPFTDTFKKAVGRSSSASMTFGLIPSHHWSYPSWVNETLAAEKRQQMEASQVLYGGSESYHHMCRYQSGFFFDHPLLDSYDWYWRIEPGVEFFCDITYDPFLYLQKYDKQYGFVLTLQELQETLPTLWTTVLEYIASRHLNITHSQRLFPFFQDKGEYTLCHFWSNFEIASLNLWRSPAYRDFFHALDQTGKFFYERWGDAPVHSLAAGLFLETDQVHYFEDVGYQHDMLRHCPSKDSGKGCRCECPHGMTEKSIDYAVYPDRCLSEWHQWVKSEKAKKPRWGWSS
ncbi:glycolipid 2-alpha-mannosyltransferase-domain-containing protein [Spinellus fusiger]|nr:glycolipid 2-alpha-mannosyltransferase-domain-containing protein [Spinellus fusiger]